MLSGDGCNTLMTPAALLIQTTVPGKGEEGKQGGLSNGRSSTCSFQAPSRELELWKSAACFSQDTTELGCLSRAAKAMSAKTTHAASIKTIRVLTLDDADSI